MALFTSLLKLSRVRPFHHKHFMPFLSDARMIHSSSPLMDNIIGIDVGSINTRSAVMLEGQVPVLLETESGRAMPCCVAVDTSIVGRNAQIHALLHPKEVFSDITRLIGMRFDDPIVQKQAAMVPYKIIEGPNGEALVEASGKTLSPRGLFSSILSRIKNLAEISLVTRDCIKAVVAVPPCFNDEQKKEMELAVRTAGFDLLSFTDQAIAAARHCTNRKNGLVAVYSFGGQFHFSILQITDGIITVKKGGSDPFLGGREFDQAVLEYILGEIKQKYKVDLSHDKLAMMLLIEEAERAKRILSSADEVDIDVHHLHTNLLEKVAIVTLTRKKFEDLVIHLVRRTRDLCWDLADWALLCDLDEIILTGGLTKIPLIQRYISNSFRGKPTNRWDPDESVAVGAALEGAFTIEDRKELLSDTVQLSLGFQDSTGQFRRVINRGAAIPVTARSTIGTLSDGQRSFRVCISQGEHDKASYNVLVGEVNLTKIPRMLAGCATCELVLELHTFGVLVVSVGSEDLGLVTKSFRVPTLSKEDVSRSVKEAMITNMMESNEFYSPELRKWAKLVIDRTRMVMQLKEYLKDYYVYSNAQEEIDTLSKELNSDKSLLLENGSLEKHILNIDPFKEQLAEMDESTLRPYSSDDLSDW
ncbi:hypothetical protein LUZ60_017652 [Juncus effusus]|nr:hypothetical protein LUZ60_017652 [Juncus effusus]